MNSTFYGFVLLVRKSCTDFVNKDTQQHSSDLNEYTVFLDNIMRPWYGLFITDRIEICNLETSFLLKLTDKIDLFRPNGRIKENSTMILLNCACLQRNFLRIHRKLPIQNCVKHENCSLTCELKVKCGFKATSPFIPSNRDIKLRYDKFSLMQLYKLSKSNEINGDFNWGKFLNISEYNPSLLFSREFPKVQLSLGELIKEPQNNLKISINGNHIFGLDKVNLDNLKFELMSSLFYRQDVETNIEFSLNLLLDSISLILCEEEVLKRIKQMQNLDIIDVEGADLIYKQLIKLLGTKCKVDKYLSDYFILPLHPSSIELSSNIDSYSDYNVPNIAKRLLSYRVNDNMPADQRKVFHQMAISLIEDSLEIEDLALLLKWWHLALIAKDVSIMVTLQPISIDNINNDKFGHTKSNEKNIYHVSCQNSTTCGMVSHFISVHEKEFAISYAYSIAIVDIGCKSLDKIWTKNIAEELFCDICKLMIENIIKN